MLRDKNLIPLSRQHQHALALCVLIQHGLAGGTPNAATVAAFEADVETLFQNEIRFHFDAEEAVLFPAAGEYEALKPLVAELRAEHGTLRENAEAARQRALGREGLLGFATALSAHVRKEERQLFEECQRLMGAEQLARLGAAVDQHFVDSGMPGASCAVPPRT